MPHITTCSKCNKIYEESSEESANDSVRKCNDCFNERGVKPMIDEKKIEACPCCGGKAHVGGQIDNRYYIYCSSCFIRTDLYSKLAAAIIIWNARKPREIDEDKLHKLWFRHSTELNPEVDFFIKRLIRDYTSGLLWEEIK